MNYIPWIYWVTFAALGCITGHQILHRQHTYRTISKKTLDFLIIFFVPSYIFLTWSLKFSLTALIVIQAALVILEYLFILIMSSKRQKNFEQLLVPFLDDLSLNLTVGASFRDAILSLKRVAFYQKNIDFCEIIEAFNYQASDDQTLYLSRQGQQLLNQLQKINSSNLNNLNKVQALRHRCRSEQVLSDKLQVATAQAKAQSLVCIFLYIGLIFYTAASRSSFFLTIWFALSAFLIISGLTLMSYISKKSLEVNL